jgi:hypothetical protein
MAIRALHRDRNAGGSVAGADRREAKWHRTFAANHASHREVQ